MNEGESLTCPCLLRRDGCRWSGWHQRLCSTGSTHTRATCKFNFSHLKYLQGNSRSATTRVDRVFKRPVAPTSFVRHCKQKKKSTCPDPLVPAQVVLRCPDVGDLHAGRLAVPRYPRRGALQAAEGRTPHGQTLQLHTWTVSQMSYLWCFLYVMGTQPWRRGVDFIWW